jgi:hypothetical protein
LPCDAPGGGRGGSRGETQGRRLVGALVRAARLHGFGRRVRLEVVTPRYHKIKIILTIVYMYKIYNGRGLYQFLYMSNIK